MSTKHTPGPWNFRQDHKPPFDDGAWFVEVFENGMQQEVICDGASKENAKLIAAAPKLLALAKAQDELIAALYTVGINHPFVHAAEDKVRKLGGAIYEAEGDKA